jgi:hypothetical protein
MAFKKIRLKRIFQTESAYRSKKNVEKVLPNIPVVKINFTLISFQKKLFCFVSILGSSYRIWPCW